jgi:hypothetical protein
VTTTTTTTTTMNDIDDLFADCDLEPKTEQEAREFARIEKLVRFRAFDPAANGIRAKGFTPIVRG